MYNIAKNITSLSSPDSIFASFLLHNHEIIVQQQLTMVHFFSGSLCICTQWTKKELLVAQCYYVMFRL